jgi:hypothetical protein
MIQIQPIFAFRDNPPTVPIGARRVKILMQLPDSNISTAHPRLFTADWSVDRIDFEQTPEACCRKRWHRRDGFRAEEAPRFRPL